MDGDEDFVDDKNNNKIMMGHTQDVFSPVCKFMDGSLRTAAVTPSADGKSKLCHESAKNVFPRYPNLIDEGHKLMVKDTVRRLMKPGTGILMLDTPMDVLGLEMEAIGVEDTLNNKMAYITTILEGWEGWRHFVSGILVQEEIFSQLVTKEMQGVIKPLLVAGIMFGVTMTKEIVQLAGTPCEASISGLDSLQTDCERLKKMGASFILVSCTHDISCFSPSTLASFELANSMSRQATTALRCNLVPILSINHNHSALTGVACTCISYPPILGMKQILASLIKSLSDHRVYLEGVIIRLAPVYPSKATKDVVAIAQTTFQVINQRLPPAIGGVLLGEASYLEELTGILNAINYSTCLKPCPVSFALGEHITEGLLNIWSGIKDNQKYVIRELTRKLKVCSQASMGHIPKDQYTIFVTKVDQPQIEPASYNSVF